MHVSVCIFKFPWDLSLHLSMWKHFSLTCTSNCMLHKVCKKVPWKRAVKYTAIYQVYFLIHKAISFPVLQEGWSFQLLLLWWRGGAATVALTALGTSFRSALRFLASPPPPLPLHSSPYFWVAGGCVSPGSQATSPLLGRTNGIPAYKTVLPSNMFETTAAWYG